MDTSSCDTAGLTFKETRVDTEKTMLGMWEQREQAVEHASSKAIALCVAVVVGNAALMAVLAIHPFPEPLQQLIAGSLAMGLHGWGAWEIGAVALAWSRSSRELAWQAGDMLRSKMSREVDAAKRRARQTLTNPNMLRAGDEPGGRAP